MTTSIDDLIVQVNSISERYSSPYRAQKIPPSEYVVLRTYMAAVTPPVPEWKKTTWQPLYGKVSDIVYFRALPHGKLLPEERAFAAFESVCRGGPTLDKDVAFCSWVRTVDIPLEQAARETSEIVRKLRDKEILD